jgi:hypothetical protein
MRPRVPPVANSKISDLNEILSDCLAVDERTRPDARSIIYRFTQLLKSGDMDPKSGNGPESALSLEPFNPLDIAYTVATLCLEQGKFVTDKILALKSLRKGEVKEEESTRDSVCMGYYINLLVDGALFGLHPIVGLNILADKVLTPRKVAAFH